MSPDHLGVTRIRHSANSDTHPTRGVGRRRSLVTRCSFMEGGPQFISSTPKFISVNLHEKKKIKEEHFLWGKSWEGNSILARILSVVGQCWAIELSTAMELRVLSFPATVTSRMQLTPESSTCGQCHRGRRFLISFKFN